MPGYNLYVLAAFPQPFFERGAGYIMYDYKMKRDGGLQWFVRYLKNGSGFKADYYEELDKAIDAAEEMNEHLINNVDSLDVSNEDKASIKIKVEKAVIVRKRRLLEERLMLTEAINRSGEIGLLQHEDLAVPSDREVLKVALFEALKETPYVKLVRLAQHGVTLMEESGRWVYARHNKKRRCILTENVSLGGSVMRAGIIGAKRSLLFGQCCVLEQTNFYS
ncbi:hypothetical protein ACLD0W_03675 [Alloalcanivorax sp. C16-1]|uniref:hypothetical protein n=1 Tax=Alloalcanivorax sp. C16-1 TaxID=3390051 RepID=UPI003970E68B